MADEAVGALGGQQRLELGSGPRRLEAPPDDRREAGVPVPLPGVAAGAGLRVGEAAAVAGALRPVAAQGLARRSRPRPPLTGRYVASRAATARRAPPAGRRTPGSPARFPPQVTPPTNAWRVASITWVTGLILAIARSQGCSSASGAYAVVSRTAASIPDCISGAADWLRNFSASIEPQQAATAAIAATMEKVITNPSGVGRWAPSTHRHPEYDRRRDHRPSARGKHRPGQQHPTGRWGDQEPIEPPLFDVTGQVDACGGPGETRSLEHADRDDEAQVAAGVEAAQVGEGTEDPVQPEKEDGRRKHAGNGRAGDPDQFVLRTRHQRFDRSPVRPPPGPGGGAHPPVLSRWRSAEALIARPSRPIPMIARTALTMSELESPVTIGSRIPLTTKLSGL